MLDRGPAVAAVALVGALVAGFVLLLLTHVLATSDIQGPGFSLRGNGALIVPFGIGLPLISAAVAACTLRYRRVRSWLRLAALAFALSLADVGLSMLLLIANLAAAYGFLQLPLLLWIVLVPVLAALVPVNRSELSNAERDGWNLAAAAMVPFGMIAGFFAGERVLPT